MAEPCPGCGGPVPDRPAGWPAKQRRWCSDECRIRHPDQARKREQRRRELARARRQRAVADLRLAVSVADYASRQASNGLPPGAAEELVWQAAESLAEVAARLRALARGKGGRWPGSTERRQRAGSMMAKGWTVPEVAAELGVHPRTVVRYRAAARRGRS